MILTACTGFPPGLPDSPVLIVTYDKQTLARALANQPAALNPWSRTQSPHAQPGTCEAGALQDVHLRLSKGLRKANDQGHPQGDGDAEPQAVHSHHLMFPVGCHTKVDFFELQLCWRSVKTRISFLVGALLFRRRNRNS